MSDWFDDGGSKTAVDVAALLDSSAVEYMAAIVSNGALVSFGTTSDGGALGVTVTLDGRWKREYFRSSEELVDWLNDASLAVAREAEATHASAAPRQRRRRTKDR